MFYGQKVRQHGGIDTRELDRCTHEGEGSWGWGVEV